VPPLTVHRPERPILDAVGQDTAVKDLTEALSQVMSYADKLDLYIDSMEVYYPAVIAILQK